MTADLRAEIGTEDACKPPGSPALGSALDAGTLTEHHPSMLAALFTPSARRNANKAQQHQAPRASTSMLTINHAHPLSSAARTRPVASRSLAATASSASAVVAATTSTTATTSTNAYISATAAAPHAHTGPAGTRPASIAPRAPVKRKYVVSSDEDGGSDDDCASDGVCVQDATWRTKCAPSAAVAAANSAEPSSVKSKRVRFVMPSATAADTGLLLEDTIRSQFRDVVAQIEVQGDEHIRKSADATATIALRNEILRRSPGSCWCETRGLTLVDTKHVDIRFTKLDSLEHARARDTILKLEDAINHNARAPSSTFYADIGAAVHFYRKLSECVSEQSREAYDAIVMSVASRSRILNGWGGNTHCSIQYTWNMVGPLRYTIAVTFKIAKLSGACRDHAGAYTSFFEAHALFFGSQVYKSPPLLRQARDISSILPTSENAENAASGPKRAAEATRRAIGKYVDCECAVPRAQASAPAGFTGSLAPHQRENLSFMLARENCTYRTEGYSKSHVASLGRDVYYNTNTRVAHFDRIEPHLCRGGILGDEMGLGKSACILALILANPCTKPVGEKVYDPRMHMYDIMLRAVGRAIDTEKPSAFDRYRTKATLLVVSPQKIGEYEAELKKFVAPGALRYVVYHGRDKNKLSMDTMLSCDLVITTHTLLDGFDNKRYTNIHPRVQLTLDHNSCPYQSEVEKSDFFRHADTHVGHVAFRNPDDKGLVFLHFHRIVFDDDMNKYAYGTNAARIAGSLTSDHRWIATGTPISVLGRIPVDLLQLSVLLGDCVGEVFMSTGAYRSIDHPKNNTKIRESINALIDLYERCMIRHTKKGVAAAEQRGALEGAPGAGTTHPQPLHVSVAAIATATTTSTTTTSTTLRTYVSARPPAGSAQAPPASFPAAGAGAPAPSFCFAVTSPVVYTTKHLTMTRAERCIYARIHEKLRVILDRNLAGRPGAAFANVMSVFNGVFAACSHPGLLDIATINSGVVRMRSAVRTAEDVAANTANNIVSMTCVDALKSGKFVAPECIADMLSGMCSDAQLLPECPVCMEFTDSPLVLHCMHVMCRHCFFDLLSFGAAACPTCRRAIDSRNSLFEFVLPPPDAQPQVASAEAAAASAASAPPAHATYPRGTVVTSALVDEVGVGSKILALAADVQAVLAASPDEKCVVVTSHVGYVGRIAEAFALRGIDYLTLTGRVPAVTRTRIIVRFSAGVANRVLIITSRIVSVGVNLQAANHMFIANPITSAEHNIQLVSRLHRMGQTRPVHIVRYVMGDTIESKVHALLENSRIARQTAAASAETSACTSGMSAAEMRMVVDIEFPANFADSPQNGTLTIAQVDTN